MNISWQWCGLDCRRAACARTCRRGWTPARFGYCPFSSGGLILLRFRWTSCGAHRDRGGRLRILRLHSAAGGRGDRSDGLDGMVPSVDGRFAIECRVGFPVAIRKAESRRQKHDRRDAALLLQLLAEDRFPTIWMPSTELRDLRALVFHRHQWVRASQSGLMVGAPGGRAFELTRINTTPTILRKKIEEVPTFWHPSDFWPH